MVNDFVLADGSEEILVDRDITVFIGPDGVERAAFRLDENEDPLPHCDPNRFGYALTMIQFIDGNNGFAVCEVMKLSDLLSLSAGIEMEMVEAV